MGQKYRNLMPLITAPENLRLAFHRARDGKRFSRGCLYFKEHAEANLDQIRYMLLSDAYQVGDYTTFKIYEPKERDIQALPFFDRVVQHALVNVAGPIFDKVFLPVSYACREGKGTHAAVIGAQAAMRRLFAGGEVHCLKMDFSKYFASIDRSILHAEIRRKISCRATLRLIETITPTTGIGLPIGNLTSQLWANLYGHIWDRWLIHEQCVDTMFRYMDDTLVIGNDSSALHSLRIRAEKFLRDCLHLRFSKWSINPVSRGIPFLGYRIWPTHKLIKRDSVQRARRKIRSYRKSGDQSTLEKFLPSWKGHAAWADSHNLMAKLGIV